MAKHKPDCPVRGHQSYVVEKTFFQTQKRFVPRPTCTCGLDERRAAERRKAEQAERDWLARGLEELQAFRIDLDEPRLEAKYGKPKQARMDALREAAGLVARTNLMPTSRAYALARDIWALWWETKESKVTHDRA